ncbi:hypothetical protein NQ314_012746 [Rhamnusium bicolor]|uniref:Uncharacterized protein n=1 Tax=Rhamnusium bicolor TaxID=1586634 RepID=A0AAV8X9Z9_9CUCU|nr:hypothetical protein NQ314_012746 [Rhamnusium bicolor]
MRRLLIEHKQIFVLDFSIGGLVVTQSFILALSTASPKPVTINIQLEEETDFYVQRDKIYSLSVSPSEPRYVFYNFQHNSSDTVVIEVDSEDDICLTVSVQDSRVCILLLHRFIIRIKKN